MATSQNGWPVLNSGSAKLHTWTIPARNGYTRVTLRNGSAGFLLVHNALRFSEYVEDITGGITDDWGYAYRPIRGKSDGFSNHAAGTAIDLNATKHPLGKSGTFTKKQVDKIHFGLTLYDGCIRWGGDYSGRKDEMHFEIVKDLGACETVARRLMVETWQGRKILENNPGQRAVILS